MSFHEKRLTSLASHNRLAVCSPDGAIHLCDFKTDERKHHQLQPIDLPTVCTCLTWMTDYTSPGSVACKKKFRTSKSQYSKSNEFIAIGSAAGDILLLNACKREIVQRYNKGHSSRVNCISWGKGNTFYSCSSDRHIVEWSLSDPAHKYKWKAEKGEIYHIAAGPYLKTMLSAGKMIKLWDLETKQLLRKYAGHGTPVFSLSFLSISSISSQETSGLELVDGLYFLSAAAKDKTLCAWQIKSQKHKKTATCAFSLPSNPSLTDVLPAQTSDKPSQVLAVTDDQQILLFSHVLNGHTKKPLVSTKSIQIVTENSNPLNVICASFKKHPTDSVAIVNIAYGDVAGVAFEQVNINDHPESDIVLVREDPAERETLMDHDKLKGHELTNTKATSAQSVEVEASGDEKSRRKRKSKLPLEAQLTIEERLQALNPDKGTIEEQPSALECAALLTQGLQDNDEAVINQVFQFDDATLIADTVRLLSLSVIIPFIKELSRRPQNTPERCLITAKWMNVALDCHSAYIGTFPDVIEMLAGLPSLVGVRSEVHRRLLLTEGKLDLIMSQITTRRTQAMKESNNEALYVFEDESSDDEQEDYMEGVMPSQSDSFEEWDDFSDAEDKNVTGSEELMLDEG